jgi:hypothetical protein
MSDFMDKVKSFFDKSLEVSKDALSKAGSAVSDYSDKTMTKIGVKQLEGKIQKIYAELGSMVYDYIEANNTQNINGETEFVKKAIEDINKLKEEIKSKNEELNERLSENSSKND